MADLSDVMDEDIDLSVTDLRDVMGRDLPHVADLINGDECREAGISWLSETESSTSPVGKTASMTSNVSLSLRLKPELLRGTPLSAALSGFCQHWAGLSCGPERGALFNLGRAVLSIDVFLSHDWATSRWMKLLALVLYFNSRAAAIASLLWSIALGVAKTQLGTILQGELWTFSCYPVFLVVLFFWQRIRSCFVSPWMVFLDKLCIHQENDELKQMGILGLGAFVRRSNRLLMLWSKRTFGRLWCAYEVACFLNYRPMEQLEILPVTVAAILFLMSTLWHVIIFSFVLAREALAGDSHSDLIFLCAVYTPCVSLVIPLVNYYGLGLMDDLDQLPQQLESFQIQACECFCCSNSHKHPDSGEEMICDRQLVYEMLANLYSVQKMQGDPLDSFNKRIQEELRPQILRQLRLNLGLKYMASLVLVSNLPELSTVIWDISRGPALPMSGFDYAAWCARLVIHWLHLFLVMVFSLTFSRHLWKLRNIPFFRSKLLCSICLAPIQCIVVGVLEAGMELALAKTSETSLLPLLPFLIELTLNIFLHYL